MRTSRLLGAILLAPIAAAHAASFQVIDGVSGVVDAGFGYGAGGNGLVLAGGLGATDESPGGTYRWTAATGYQFTGTLREGSYSRPTAIANDGSVLVGEDCCGSAGFKWSPGPGIQAFGSLSDSGESVAYDVSADGGTIVGLSGKAPGDGGGYVAVRWTAAGGLEPLGHLPGREYISEALAVSADGSAIAGISAANSSTARAFLWTQAGGMIDLSDLPNGIDISFPAAVSNNGTVVGRSYDGAAREAFRWTGAGGIQGLGFLQGSTESEGKAISADGSVIGGESLGVANRAFLWTEAGGMQRLLDVLVASGVTGLEGWDLQTIKAISADGQWIVGTGDDGSHVEKVFLANIAPVPVPPVAWLLGGAFAAIGWRKRRAATA